MRPVLTARRHRRVALGPYRRAPYFRQRNLEFDAKAKVGADMLFGIVGHAYLEHGIAIHVGLMGEAVMTEHFEVFANAEDILGIRQTKYDPLLLPAQLVDGFWTVDVWAPADGFVLNGGIRLRFGIAL